MATKESYDDILKCSVCTKLLDKPKTLPCLHMFCGNCLIQFLSSKQLEVGPMFLKCPVCYSVIAIPENTEPSEYLTQLPTNEIIEAIIKPKNISLYGTSCGPCQNDGGPYENDSRPSENDGRKRTARKWCNKCGEGFCNECYKFHQKSGITKMHRVVNIEDLANDAEPIQIRKICFNHTDDTVEYYCKDHQEICCGTCATSFHKNCNNIESLEEVSRNCKESEEFVKILKNIQDNIGIADQNIEQNDKTMNMLEQEKNSLTYSTKTFSQGIIKHVENLEQKFMEKFEQMHKEQIRGIRQREEAFKSAREILKNCDMLSHTLARYSSDVTLFLEKNTIEKTTEEQGMLLAQLTEKSHTVKYEVNWMPELANLTSTIRSLGTMENVKSTTMESFLGEMIHTKSDPDINPLDDKPEEKPEEIVSFCTIKCDTDRLHGVDILPDGRVLLTSKTDNLICVYDIKGQLQGQVKMPGAQNDVTMLSEDEAVVTCAPSYAKHQVCKININTMTITQKDLLPNVSHRGIHGIATFADTLFVACYDEILVIDSRGHFVKKIQTPGPDSNHRYITAVTETKICYTNTEDDSVVCINEDGGVVFTYKNEDLKTPCGITSDNKGNIYIVDDRSSCVHQLSADGELMRIVLSKADGIIRPVAISVDRNSNKLVLTHSGSMVTVYQMK